MYQMQNYVIVMLLFSVGNVSAGFEKVWRQAELVTDIYQRFPHSCIFIVNPEVQQQGIGR
jgi:hypothetical protein